jgi:CRP-like cAMP-binding protein
MLALIAHRRRGCLVEADQIVAARPPPGEGRTVPDLSEYPLHRPEIYEALELGDRKLIMAMTETRVLAARELLIRPGEEHRFVYRLRSGWLARSRTVDDGRHQILLIFLPGDLVGVKSMLLHRQPDATESLTPASVRLLDEAALRRLVLADPDIALRIMFQLGEDERRLHNGVVGLGRADAEARIAAMLIGLRRRLRHIGLAQGDSFNLPMTQQQIGDHTGLTVVHVNRVLRRLRGANVVTLSQGMATIHDHVELHQLARPALDIFDNEEAAAEV